MKWLRKLPFLREIFRKGRDLRKQVRVVLHRADVYFRPQHKPTSEMVRVLDISMGGMGLEKSRSVKWPSEGVVIPGRLYLKDSSMDISCKIIHKSKGAVGCKFSSVPEGFYNRLSNFLDVEFSAQKLIQIQPNILRAETPGAPYYFYGKNSDELYFVVNEGEISFFSLIVSKKFLSGGANQPFKMGEVISEVQQKVHGYKRIDPVSWSEQVEPELFERALRFISNIEPLNDDHRQLLIKELRKKTN